MRYLVLFLFVLVAACGNEDASSTGQGESRITRVVVAEPTPRDVEHLLTALGSVESISDPTLSAETSGQVQRIEVLLGHAHQAIAGGGHGHGQAILVPVAHGTLTLGHHDGGRC